MEVIKIYKGKISEVLEQMRNDLNEGKEKKN